MTELLLFRAQVLARQLGYRHFQREQLADAESVTLDAEKLLGIVAEQPDRVYAEVAQDLDAAAVFSFVGAEAQALVGFDRIVSLRLERVRADLVREADAPPFLIEVHEDATALGRNPLQGGLQLVTAVALHGMENIPREAARMQADQDVAAVAEIPVDQRDMGLPVVFALVDVNCELAVLCGERCRRDAFHKALRSYGPRTSSVKP